MASKEILRDDLLILLSSMGIILPDTKLSADELNKKLGLAFDASQQLFTHLPHTPVDPSTFPSWDVIQKDDKDSKTLYEATQIKNVSEMCEGVMEQPKLGGRAHKQETFKEMRQSIMAIAYMYEQGVPELFYVDENRKGILLKVLDVRKVNKDVPFFLFEYKEVILNPGDNYPTSTSLPIIDLERRALLKLFRRNSKKLLENFYTELETEEKDVDGGVTHKSFVLPLCPLNMQTLGKLTLHTGCQVCGKKATCGRCLQCLSVVYCSKECQKKDWPDHKLACISLKGGTWSTIRLSNFLDGKHCTLINRLDPLSTGSGIHSPNDGASLPGESHKGKVFLAKFQIALVGGVPSNMMIYDRQRSFQLLWLRNSSPTLFDRAAEMMAGQFKLYRWVRWVAVDEMQVCFNRSPARDPVW